MTITIILLLLCVVTLFLCWPFIYKNYIQQYKFRLDRPLDHEDRVGCLSQKAAVRCLPHASVIKMNSTYLECCDPRFETKGGLTFVGMILCSVLVMWLVFVPFLFGQWWFESPNDRVVMILVFIAVTIFFCLPICVFGIWYLSIDSTLYHTHHPQRFNRKTRMVHVFLEREKNGIVSIPWNEVYFAVHFSVFNDTTRGSVRGYQLSEDGKTVLARFSLGRKVELDNPRLLSQWEFVRRYMEEGPEDLIDRVDAVLDISEQRETLWAGIMQLWHCHFEKPGPIGFILFPFYAFFGLIRWLGMRIGSIPVWPKEIEDTCQIDPDDPYILPRR